LDAVFATFMAEGKSQQFIADIATLLNVPVSSIFINNITEGSSVVNGTVTSSDQTALTTIQSTLQANTGTYAGFTVLSASYAYINNANGLIQTQAPS